MSVVHKTISWEQVTSAALHSAQQQHEQKAAEEARRQEEAAQRDALHREFPSLRAAANPPPRTCLSHSYMCIILRSKCP